AAAVLRKASERLRRADDTRGRDMRGGDMRGGDMDVAVTRFSQSVEALESAAPIEEAERIVPIDELFYSDGGPGVVQRATTPPMDPEQRFRQDVAMRAEHVQRLLADARAAADASTRDRVARELRSELLEIERVSASFGAHQVGSFFGEAAREALLMDGMHLDALDAGSSLLLDPAAPATSAHGALHDIEHRLAILERVRRNTPLANLAVAGKAEAESPVPAPSTVEESRTEASNVPLPSAPHSATPTVMPAIATPSRQAPAADAPAADAPAAAAPAAEAPASEARATEASAAPAEEAPAAAPPRANGLSRRATATPSGRELQALLQEGIAGFHSLEEAPLSEPTSVDDDKIVPIEALLFRGQSALRRAVQVRDDMRARDVTDHVVLQEIFDLLDLASTE
ncbi:MAG: hypothetical protein ABIZ91_16410, partial [Gemmatimonadaceae bacterium]